MARWRRLVGLLILIVALPAAAQEWPNRPIRFIVPFPAGGSVVGAEAAAKSAPDGYTILIGTDQVSTWQHLFRLNFDPMKDLVPIVQLSRQPVVLAVHPSLGPTTLAELIALAKQRPGMSYATSGVGSQQHIAAQWFAHIAGIKLDHVPYRGGGQAINDLVAGHVKIASLGSSPLIPHYKAGTLRLLAQTANERSPSLPDVPTYQEAGIGVALDQWLGVFVPTGTPPAIEARLNSLINQALSEATIRNSFLQSAQEPVGGSPEAFARLVHEDFEKYGRLVRNLDIKAN